MCVARYTLAVDRRKRADGGQSADFINCVAFGKNGEFAEKYLRKGGKIAVEGHWQTGSFKNKDGLTVYTNDCVVDQHEFVESKKQDGSPEPEDGFLHIPDNVTDLPFTEG